MEINLLMSSNKAYLPYLAACLASVLDNSNAEEKINFYLVSFADELSQHDISQLDSLRSIKNYTLKLIEIERSEVDNFYESIHTMNMYLRLFVPDILYDLDKVLYLDCDMIVLGSLGELYQYNLGSSILGATVDSDVVFKSGDVWEYTSKINPSYFNSGMLLMNLDEMRRDGFTARMQDWLRGKKDLMFPDQDALNTLYGDRVSLLPLRYNAQFPLLASIDTEMFNCEHSYYSEIKNPVIVHFCTQQKPWLYLPEPPYKKEFERYLAMTPWRGIKQSDKTFYNIARKNLAAYLRRLGLKE